MCNYIYSKILLPFSIFAGTFESEISFSITMSRDNDVTFALPVQYTHYLVTIGSFNKQFTIPVRYKDLWMGYLRGGMRGICAGGRTTARPQKSGHKESVPAV